MFSRKYSGYGMDLYRSRDDRWLAGVCGGIADNINMPSWLVRLGFITLFLFTGGFAILLYVAGVVLLAKRPRDTSNRSQSHTQHQHHREHRHSQRHSYSSRGETPHNLKDALFGYGPTPTSQVQDISERMRRVDEKLRQMEGYVTSRKFQFDREMRRS
ncbi:PspC domain-containing protein [Pontibacterium granulatum]|uniref:PspC domain-containing protein n=1 Tax=Pontibacterium granulatum TaxID=2036029 RepID=UPI00249BD7DD|nr:PspC domain-containing protein [Pontibacterium granulatum]MDI3325144.1 PspC domain-containing protein [Pontibacterium granulatum]